MKQIFLILCQMACLAISAQTLSGTIVDENTRPMSFVTLSFSHVPSGSYTDQEGKFTIDLKSSSAGDTIMFSHIGYEPQRCAISQLSAMLPVLQMKPMHYSMNEIVIKPNDAEAMIKDALIHIKENYPCNYSKNHVVYKDYWKINDTAIRYYFFDYNLYLPSYLAKDSPDIYTTDIRHEMYNQNTTTWASKNSSPNRFAKQMYLDKIFDPSELVKNGFSIVSTTETIDSNVYTVIKFKHKPIPIIKAIAMDGVAYISKADNGIRFINLHMHTLHAGRIFLLAKIDTLNYNQEVSFKKIDGKYVLEYITNSTYAKGKFMGQHMSFFESKSLQVIDRVINQNMEAVKKTNEIDEILLKEIPKNIKELTLNPDLK